MAYSDHLHIWLELEGGALPRPRKRLFQFEAMWVGEKECERIIENSWKNDADRNDMGEVMAMISNCS